MIENIIYNLLTIYFSLEFLNIRRAKENAWKMRCIIYSNLTATFYLIIIVNLHYGYSFYTMKVGEREPMWKSSLRQTSYKD